MEKIILNGSYEAKKIFKSLKSKSSLVAILIGTDPASQIYVNIKEKKAKEIGVKFTKYILPATVSEKKVINLMNKLNKDKKIKGILVQLPLPKKFNAQKIIETININKDVDGFINKKIVPPTIQSIIHLIKTSKIKLDNKQCAILANSPEFAEPLKKQLKKNKIITKIILEPKKNNFKKYNIIIIALGKKYWLKPEMIKKNTIIIDVGINRDKNTKKIYGDVHPNCFKKSKYISPVPGGVGPLTVAFLFKNLIKLL